MPENVNVTNANSCSNNFYGISVLVKYSRSWTRNELNIDTVQGRKQFGSAKL